MFEKKLLENLKPEEEVLALVRRTPVVSILPALLSAFFIIAPFFFLYVLLKWGAPGGLIFALSLAFGVFLGIRTLWLHNLNAFIITAERVIDVDQKGLFHKVVSEAAFGKIQDVSYSVKGIFPTVFQFGTVIIQTAGSNVNLELSGVRSPQKVQDLIVKLQDQASQAQMDKLSADELLAMVKKIKAGIGEEQFRRMVARRTDKSKEA
ncbi:PH domain-containing protein [Candidatus Parcubacteria bacterium]|jgi:membrane protein YdbS with pleckstrin-like domain|nr:MAG: PH domain-containing protein [Candidatus Parcubacteria bacterium]